MNHYFTTPSSPLVTHDFSTTVFGRQARFTAAAGVFSGSRLDPGTSVLLRTVTPPAEGRLLDLGCGIGTIAVGLALTSPGLEVDAVDVNGRAVMLTALNAQRNGVARQVTAMHPDAVPESTRYDEIWSNPPIRIGKQALHQLLSTWLARLVPGGHAHLVVSKNLGGDSLHRWLDDQGHPTERVASSKGFRILRVGTP